MSSWKRNALALALALGGLQAAVTAQKIATTIQRVTVLGAGEHIEVEITASGPVTPQAQVITGPDRLIIDFPNAVPGSSLRNLAVNRGDVKNVRVGLFASAPPVTRVVVDLGAAPHYQVFPSGKTVIVKLSPQNGMPPLTSASAVVPMTTGAAVAVSAPVVPAPKPAPKYRVDFRNGNLTIWSDKATLAEILNEVHRRTGAEVPIPAGADQERVAADMKPMPAREALATLLNGSRFNFVMVGSAQDSSQLRGVFLTPKTGGVGISVTPTTYSVANKQPQVAEADADQDPGPPENNANNMQQDAPAPEDAPQQPQQ